MNGGVFMTGKADETNFALLFGFLQRFSGASRTHKKFWIVVEGYAVNLPKVQVISLQSVERLLEHLHGQGSVPPVRAHFRHQERFVPAAPQRLAHPIFTFSAMVFPTVVEKRDPVIHGFVNDPYGSLLVLRISQVVSAQSQRGNLHIVLAEFSQRNRPARSRLSRGFLSLPPYCVWLHSHRLIAGFFEEISV